MSKGRGGPGRFLRVMDKLRHVVGPAQVGDGGSVDTVRSDEKRREDLQRLRLRRITNPDGSSYLVSEELGEKDAGQP
ncbi:hypothetical protein LWF01_11510 [Saxibacter everestensis]|uniref:Uncharacterized protein n=1 Tax=Saxibacter everestensis TaxID=2909229 RepID=A0ABY8QP72_9MICO|nr:hypothetical protein LWF01_11510 [Brevibacteriaceae bacterium ZFBP1038]